ncbi:hypothetical protein Bca52824_018987 [Brassica carinata]|uniref:Uncharacterized protein n=1 Tax=Brassica carinata TaxID=52824 RepID=A0A8X8AY28_BRACI|nr:hypothetical protein Bca52824_018987 [Brassica carinata]
MGRYTYSQPSQSEDMFGNNSDSEYSETEDLIRRDQAELSLERCSSVIYPPQPEVEFGFPQVCYCGSPPQLVPSRSINGQEPQKALPQTPAPKRAPFKDKAVIPPKETIIQTWPPSTADNTPSPGSPARSESSASVAHDLSKGSLCVDLSGGGRYEEEQQSSSASSGSSSDISPSEEGEILPDEGDEFIEVFSKRHKKREKAKARARGPSTL